MASQIEFYDNTSLDITYTFENNEYMFDSQRANLTVDNIKMIQCILLMNKRLQLIS